MDMKSPDQENLGEKHKSYNELLRKTLSNESAGILSIDYNKHDPDNFLVIDIASEKKDVQCILNILKCDDMLYVSRALQKCTWLITDDQYTHIINSKYLYEQLLPEMTTKAGNKLMKLIRKHLNDEKRVEEFYTHEENMKQAVKWLPNCSVQFIENNIKKCVKHIDVITFRRICEKSMSVFEIAVQYNILPKFYNATIFLLNTHIEKYLDIVEEHCSPTFNAKTTNILMNKTPDRIIKKFEKYVQYIDIPTFVKYLKKEDIKDFLYEQVNKDLGKCLLLKRFLNSHKVIHFIEAMPKEERFEFVKKVFIDEIHGDEDESVLRPEICNMRKLAHVVCINKHEWYIFAPFDTAFEEIKKMIMETHLDNKYSMLKTLILCARKNEKDLQAILQYYINNHINDENRLKKQFVSDLINNSKIYNCNNDTWKLLNEVLKSMDVYIEKEDKIQDCIILIILYHILNNEDVPKIIQNKFSFNTLKRFGNKINEEEKEKVFNFLYTHLLNKIQNESITTEIEFNENIEILEKMLTLLDDWKKQLVDFPFLLNKIKDMAIVKREKSWDSDLSTLYNINKSWKKEMFEESLLLNPSEEVCINALKHDPGLLVRHKSEVQKLCCDDNMSLTMLLNKLRIYWPESLAINWANEYQERLSIMGGHKATTRGICKLIPQKSLLDIIKKYAPKEPKINWKEVNELTFSLQKNIAKSMHIARPQLDTNAIFWYAKGDYLQYALPSLLAVFYNMNSALSREYIPKLLDAPVSVQKHGIRFAFNKLDATKLKNIFLNIWNNSQNPTIRAELFKHTFKLLATSESTAKVDEIGSLLQLFIDNLTHKDDPKVLDLLVNIHEVPLAIRANCLIKCYNVYKRLLPHFASKDVNNYKNHMQTLAEYSRKLMEIIDVEFVVQIIQDFLDKEFFNSEGKCTTRISPNNGMIKVISAYLLCTKDTETQAQRYNEILVPLMKRVYTFDNNTNNESHNNDNFAAVLKRLYRDLDDYVIEKKFNIPYKMFCDIQENLQLLPVSENYTTLTMWKLTTALTKLLSENDTIACWDEVTIKIAPDFSHICRSFLKEDVNTKFTCIYVIFSRVLKQFLNTMPTEAICIICEGLLEDKKFIQAYLTVIQILPTNAYYAENEKEQYNKIHQIILEQSSVEVKMHYYNAFKNYIGQ